MSYSDAITRNDNNEEILTYEYLSNANLKKNGVTYDGMDYII